jgi:AmmeMemoRadiSam system protein B
LTKCFVKHIFLLEEMMIRKSSVAGFFYPGNKKDLTKLIDGMIDPDCQKKKAICAVSPHAGLIYSGPVAGALFSSISLPEKYVILGFSHRNYHDDSALMRVGTWETPMGEVSIDSDIADRILSRSSHIKDNPSSHSQEHSIEVQLPFIQYFKSSFSMVPISVSGVASWEELKELGESIADSIKEGNEDVLIIASTDMSHYVSHEEAREKDLLAIEKVLNRDARGLIETVRNENISMCGFQPTAVAILAANRLGAQEAELIKYQTSGDVSGNYSEVVGYAGIRIR